MVANVLPASRHQVRVYLSPGRVAADGAYNVVTWFRVSGPLDVDRLRNAFGKVIARHPGLRTTFAVRDGQAVQIIHERIPDSVFRVVDLSDLPDGPIRQAALDELAAEITGTPCCLDLGPLIHVTVVRLGERRYELFIVLDHVISDEWSSTFFTEEIAAVYDEPDTVLEPAPAYRQEYPAEQFQRDRAYWISRFEPPAPRPFADLSTEEFPGAFDAIRYQFKVPVDLVDHRAPRLRVTPHVYVLAGYYAALWEITRESDLTIATFGDTRRTAAEFQTLGYFQNLFGLRTTVEADLPFTALLDRVKREFFAAMRHRGFAMLDAFDLVPEPPGPRRNRLYQALLTYSGGQGNHWRFTGVELEAVDLPRKGAFAEIHLGMFRSGQVYNADLTTGLAVEPAVAERFVRVFDGVLRKAVDCPSMTVAELVTHPGDPVIERSGPPW